VIVMPRRDGSGPTGQGAMTGRGLGACNNASRASGRGMGLGLGSGRGYNCRRVVNTQATVDNRSFLTEQKSILEAKLEEINKQLKE
jgi:hypothetical protein